MRRPINIVFVLALTATACTAATTDTTLPNTTSSATTAVSGSDPDSEATSLPTTSAIAWERIDDPEAFDGGFMNAVTTGGPGLVAVGTTYAREDAAVWVSSDATDWERIASEAFGGVPDGNGVDGDQEMRDITTFGDLIVAVGSDEMQESRDVNAAVWLSTDGYEWEKVDDEDLGGGGFQAMNAVTAWNGALYAGGEYQDGETGAILPGLWRSMDGRTWDRIQHPLFLAFGAVVTDLGTRGSTLIAVGFDDLHENRPVVWVTRDGETWDAVSAGGRGDAAVGEVEEPEGTSPFSLFMTGITTSPDGWVAIGTLGDPSVGIVWTSEDGYDWGIAALLTDYDRPGADVVPASAIPTSNGMALVGTSPLDTSGFPPLSFAVAWVSTDSGRSWAQSVRTSSVLALEGPSSPWHMGTIHDVVLHEGRLISVGYISKAEVTTPGEFYDQAVWIGTWQ